MTAPWIIVWVAVLCGWTLLNPSVVWVARPLLQQIKYQLTLLWWHYLTFRVGHYNHLWVSSALVPAPNRISRIGCVARSRVTSCPLVPATFSVSPWILINLLTSNWKTVMTFVAWIIGWKQRLKLTHLTLESLKERNSPTHPSSRHQAVPALVGNQIIKI